MKRFFTYLTNRWGVILIRLQHSAIEVQNSTGQSGNQIYMTIIKILFRLTSESFYAFAIC